MDPRNFLTLAKRLTSDASAENHRSAISRSYYAAYHVAKNFLGDLGIKTKKSGHSHGEVTKCIGNSGDLTIEKSGSKLRDLQGMRIKADYEMENKEVEKNVIAILQIKIACNVVKELDNCLKDNTRIERIKPNIMTYYKTNINPV